MELFGVDIAEEIADAFEGDLLPAVLSSKTYGERDPNNPTGGIPSTSTDYPTEGIVTGYAERFIDGTTIREGDRRVTLLGKPLPVEPSQGDRVTIESLSYDILSVNRDAAAATYICHCRR